MSYFQYHYPEKLMSPETLISVTNLLVVPHQIQPLLYGFVLEHCGAMQQFVLPLSTVRSLQIQFSLLR